VASVFAVWPNGTVHKSTSFKPVSRSQMLHVICNILFVLWRDVNGCTSHMTVWVKDVVTLQWVVQDCRQKYVLNREVLIILINSVSYVFLLISMFCSVRAFFANWHSPATLTEVFPCFFLSCKANARVYLAKTRHGPHSS
jgi:hypothetical protein